MDDSRGSGWGYLIVAVVVFVVITLIVGACSAVTSREAPRKGYFAICQTGGPIEGDTGLCGFRANGSGKQMTGGWYDAIGNTLVEFPATNRFWWAQNDDADPSRPIKGADRRAQELPVANGGRVAVAYKLTFKLKQDEAAATDLYKKHGTRSYGGPLAADDPDQWFRDFLASQVNSVVERVNREEISPESCSDLNPACDLNKLNKTLDQLASDNPKVVAEAEQNQTADGAQANSKLVALAQRIEDRLAGPADCQPTSSDIRTCGELAKALEGEFMIDLSYEIIKVDPPAALVEEIDGANAALATLVKTKAEARNKVEEAEGTANARSEEARGRRALAEAISDSPAVAQIEAMKALCGVTLDEEGREIPKGCANLQFLGGNGSGLILQPRQQQGG
jgi:hypothetical protein